MFNFSSIIFPILIAEFDAERAPLLFSYIILKLYNSTTIDKQRAYLHLAFLIKSVVTKPGKMVVNLTEDFPLLYIRTSSLIHSIRAVKCWVFNTMHVNIVEMFHITLAKDSEDKCIIILLSIRQKYDKEPIFKLYTITLGPARIDHRPSNDARMKMLPAMEGIIHNREYKCASALQYK